MLEKRSLSWCDGPIPMPPLKKFLPLITFKDCVLVIQWPYEAAFIAFEALLRTLAQNCGVNVIQTMIAPQGKVLLVTLLNRGKTLITQQLPGESNTNSDHAKFSSKILHLKGDN